MDFTGAQLLYQPILIAQMGIRYIDKKSGAEADQRWAFHVPADKTTGFISWNQFQAPIVDLNALAGAPDGQAAFGAPSADMTDRTRMTALRNEVVDFVSRTASMILWYNPTLELYGTPGEERGSFITRVAQIAREKRDEQADEVVRKFEKQRAALEQKLEQAELRYRGEQEELGELRREDLFTTGEAVMSLMRGRTSYTLSRMSRTRRFKKAQQERTLAVEQAIIDLEQQMEALQKDVERTLQENNDEWQKVANTADEYKIKPFKKDVTLEIFGIGWLPQWYTVLNNQALLLPAFAAGV
jgi:hypothetical protein